MDACPRRLRPSLVAADIPLDPGVYAVYVRGERKYVGKAKDLNDRLWNHHLRTRPRMTDSAFRRNVAEHLGIASSADIKALRYITTVEDAARVSAVVDTCEFTWIACESEAEAEALEGRLKAEYLPPWTKR